MAYHRAGIDVPKQVWVVVVAEVTEPGEWIYERGQGGARASAWRRFAECFPQRGVQEVVRESPAP